MAVRKMWHFLDQKGKIKTVPEVVQQLKERTIKILKSSGEKLNEIKTEREEF